MARELQALLLSPIGERLHQLFDGVAQRKRNLLELQLARLDFREVQDVVHDGEQRLRPLSDGPDVFALFDGELRIERELRHADDRRHRRADLVAHVREEIGLGLRRRFRFRLGGAQLAHELRQLVGVLGFGVARLIQFARVGFELLVGNLLVGHVPGHRVNQLVLEQRHGGPRQPAIRPVAAAIAVHEVDRMPPRRSLWRSRAASPRDRPGGRTR